METMRINRPSGSSVVQRSGATAKKSKGRAAGRSGGDSVKVSDATSLREKAMAMLDDLSPVRMERIEAIRDALEDGSFKSDSQKVAARIVCNAISEHTSWN